MVIDNGEVIDRGRDKEKLVNRYIKRPVLIKQVGGEIKKVSFSSPAIK